MINHFLFALIIITTISCKTSEKQKADVSKTELNGFYEQQGEGQIVEINDSLVTSFYSSSFNCFPEWKISRDYFNTQTPTIKVIDENTFTNQEGYTVFTYKKLKIKPTFCKELTEEQINSNIYNFETLWHTFNDQYAFFKERNIDWNELKKKYKSQFTEQTSPFEFYLLLEKMVLELDDAHSDFEVPDDFDDQWHTLNKKQDTTNYRNLAKDKILENFVTDVQKYNGEQIAWGNIDENLAYIQINGMDGLADYQPSNASEYWEKAEESDDYDKDLIDGTHKIATKIINEIQNKKVCIIDFRFNQGGYDWVGLAFMSHFIDKKYNIFKKKRRFEDNYSDYQIIDLEPTKPAYLKNVYILTSPFTVSAAETTTIATMNFPNFKRVGSYTNGALSDVLYKELPNGWTYWLSNEVYETTNGKLFEVTGIPPHYKIDYPKEEIELFKAMNSEFDNQDRAIEKVKEIIK